MNCFAPLRLESNIVTRAGNTMPLALVTIAALKMKQGAFIMQFKTIASVGYLAVGVFAEMATPAIGGQDGKPAVDSVRRSVVQDPEVRAGVLPNGMRYAIMHASVPAHGLSLRLGIDVGSFEEQDAERGFAHFIEHMAFRATRSAPQGDIDRRFSALGAAFGRDLNAATKLDATTYRLDFAETDERAADEGFRWLRDVADGVLFRDAEVTAERGVVLAEMNSRDGPEKAVHQAIGRFQAPGARGTARDPIGLVETLTAARADTLRAFYDRWYRPENAVLVVAGSQSVDLIEQKLRAAFSSWQGKGAAAPRAAPGKIDFGQGLDTFTTAAPALPSLVSACHARPAAPRGEDELVRYTGEIRAALWRDILNERFKTLVNAGNSGLLGAMMMSGETPEFGQTCLIVVPPGDGWEKGLAAAQAELRRFVANGPTEAEVETGIEEGRAALRGAINGAAARTAAARADDALDRMLDHRPVLSPREAMHAYDLAVEDLDAPAVKAIAAAGWAGPATRVAVVLPKQVDRELVRAAWARNESGTALAAYVDHAGVAWPYTDFGKPGVVTAREVVAEPGFVRLHFANGVILNFKQTALEANGVELRARFGHGRHDLPANGYLGATFGSALFAEGGLGRLSAEDIQRSMHGTKWRFQYQIGTDFFQFSSSTSTANAQTQLQVFAAFMSDPGFRSTTDERLPGAVDIAYRSMSINPGLAAGEAMLAQVDPDDPERLPPIAVMAALRSTDFDRLLRPALTTAPIELTVVGDISEEVATELVAATFGALPARTAPAAAQTDPHFLRFPDRAFPVIRASHGGPADRAAASVIWPLYVAEPERRREEYALKLVAGVFNDQLRHRARVELGKTYSPEVATAMPDHADQGMLTAQIEALPADIDAMVTETEAVAARLRSGAITADEVEAVRRPLLSQAAAAQGKNSWWAAALSGSSHSNAVTRELTGYVPLLSAITLDEVKAAAAKWLARPPIVTIATPGRPSGTLAVPATGPAPVGRTGQ